jgi:hypothetical protein
MIILAGFRSRMRAMITGRVAAQNPVTITQTQERA